MSSLITARNASLVIAVVAAVITSMDYSRTQPALPIIALVFLGCAAFWFLLSSAILSFFLWLHSELVLMGRRPQLKWQPSAFKSSMLIARLIGWTAPFAIYYPQEGWAVFTNPEHWAIVPLSLGLAIVIIAIPLWLAVKVIGSKLSTGGRRVLVVSIAILVVAAIALGSGGGPVWSALGMTPSPSPASPTPSLTLPEPTATATPAPTATPSPTPTATPTPRPVAKPSGLRIPKIGVSAVIVHLDLKPDGSLPSPDGPEPVAWYTFSAQPGTVGNAVLSGHVDWHTGVLGVFWRLRELVPGDRVYIDIQDGTELVYEVTSTKLYPASEAPVDEILGPHPGERITMISCEGTFIRAIRDYDHRRVVVAERVR